MAGVTGLEPAASGVTGRRSNRLSYTPFATALRRKLRRGLWCMRPARIRQAPPTNFALWMLENRGGKI
jgi:hypothetical protein